MSSFWSAVKQIRSEKRFKNAPAPLDAVASRVRQLQKDLQLLRRACRQDREFCQCLDNIINHNQKLPADIEKVGRWCDRLVGPFILYIEAFIKTSNAPSSMSSLRKAPFTFLEEIKELLSQLEKMTSKSCGVNAITAIVSASRRMLTLQSSNEGMNDFVFNNVHCLGSGQGVSAAFNPVDIMERALFDICVGDDKETIGELLLLQSQGTKSLAVCEVRPFGQRSLMYPPFRGSSFGFSSSETTLTLSEGENLIVMSAAPYVVTHWKPILERLFDVENNTRQTQPQAQATNMVSGLGIALGDDYDERNDQEKFGDDFEDDGFEDERPSYNRPEQNTTITTSESLNALKRISVGMPVDFSEDLAKILRGIEEEDESSPRPNAGPKVADMFAARPSTAPSALAPLPLMAPTAPFARSVPSLDPRSQGGSPASFFSEFSQSKGTPSSMASSPRTLDEADAVRKRIAARISSREKESSQERYFSPASQGEASVQSIQISDSSDEEEEFDPVVHTVAATQVISEAPPSIPAPTVPSSVYGTQRATVVRVSTPRRINFGTDDPEYVPISISNDLSAVPISPMPSSEAPKFQQTHKPAQLQPVLEYKQTAKSQPVLPRPNAPQQPRTVQSVYSPKIGTPTLQRSYSDEKHAAQENIWFEEPSKVKATLANLFKKKSKTPKSQQSPKFRGSVSKEREQATSKEPSFAPRKDEFVLETDEFVPKEPETAPPPVPVAVVAVEATPAPTQAPPALPVETAEQRPLPNSTSLRSLHSVASSSEPDLGASLGNRASTIFYKRISKMGRESFCPPPPAETSDATAVCVDSHNTTAAPMSFDSLNSLSDGSINNSRSYASLESKVTMSTANTSFGSTKAWSEFMDGVKSGAAKQRDERYEQESKQRALDEKALELKRLEAEVESKKQAIEEAASRVRQMDSTSTLASANTLDPGVGMSSQVNRSVPILRELYAEKETKAGSVYQNPNAFSSVPSLPTIQPLSVKKANSVTFSEPSTPTSITTTQFSGFLWVSKWTVNRWMPLSQKELPVEVLAAEDQDSIVITMPGSSRPIKLRFNCDCDLRVSNAHDVEVRVKGEVYMFRSRSSQRCKKFFKAIEGLQIDIQDPTVSASATSSDSDTSSGSTTSTSSRRCAPPKLNNYGPLASRTNISHYPIIEE